MADVEPNEQNTSKKSNSNNIAAKFKTIVVRELNNETYRPLTKENHERKKKLDKLFSRDNNSQKWIITILFFGVIFAFLYFLCPSVLDRFMNSSTTVSYNEKVEFVIDINNDTIEETRYQHILMDTPDMHIIQEKYDYEIVPLTKESDLSEKDTVLNSAQCINIPEVLRFDCHPEAGASQLSCTDRGCCWNPPKRNELEKHVPLNIPYCYYPEEWNLYKYTNYSQDGNNFSGFLSRKRESMYKNNVPLVKVEATSIDSSILRVKIYDPLKARYEPPWPIRSDPKPFLSQVTNTKYQFYSDGIQPGFKINRINDGTTLFNSLGFGGFIFADQFLQISALLPTNNIYGIGEHRSSLKLNTNWQSFTLFNKDQPPTENANLYGSHPFYMVIEESGMAHGVLFLNSNAMDVILQPTPAITFRTIGGIFDIYFFLGPTPADVVKQYSDIVDKPFMPPYWSLGFHLCRFGYKTLEKTKAVWNRTRAAGIPFDTQWNDLDYMEKNNDFTYNKEKFKDLPKFVEEIHSVGMHYVPLIDAGISASENNGSYPPYDEGIKQNIFVKDGISHKPFIGKVWNFVSTVWPDFTNPKTLIYYADMMSNMHKSFAYDGAWIDMNEPSNFYNGHKDGCTHNNLDYPDYLPNVVGNLLATKTLCMNAEHYLGSHYDLHNTYGTSQAIATNYALRKIRLKRPFIISRSTWIGHGHYAGHWTGDVYSSWHDLKMSIPAILSLNFYQIPMVGADICGFDGNTTAALCNRWMQLGAFYPFSRNHNSDTTIEQDPVAMGDLVVKSSKNALKIRYRLLPYLYTLFFRAHKFGETVARPLFFEFTDDRQTYDIDTQFLWGNALMINPVLEENKIEIPVYVPRGMWYDYYTIRSFFSIGKHYTLPAPLDRIPLLVRGGSILPTQKPGVTTTESRKNDFELIVVLNEAGDAKGELYWDDGDSLDSIKKKEYLWLSFTANKSNLLSTEVNKGSYNEEVILGAVQIWGLRQQVSRVFLNENEIGFKYNVFTSILDITGLQVDMRQPFTFYWILQETNDRQYY
ncbi:lysosomal alpha-glucosidase-like [Pogonomyrmex barbatus]|uniref:Lysosomal alpha-glucosidase-like n=1 Tax=Pogonomyrmex barbatus TaxID=144034 RepID=A0A6I9WG22_9HYME|nr:lysosomal alpha-glucosidase-like [Pogonomyrmex barbatus]XP_011639982.1 lysosomal alpha-glucosidase-like [Pogonomyrmex barbatus]XP_011639983.1 lysosomal alpha-glucosidase-like [Pogonomyrmex barbatus]XP_011639984.1 lysosomal alpha-glucosidase-like [Pogonomyrmex barbatus]XP_025074541.1 lysosomal alpha-glucosidase-like [Pogonomyrmex barbatus]